MNTCLTIEPRIDNLVELSSICRGEWCRLLEAELDEFEREMNFSERREDIRELSCLRHVSEQFRQGYKNLSPIYMA